MRGQNATRGRIPVEPIPYKGKSLPREGRYHLRSRTGKRVTQGQIPRRLRYDEEDGKPKDVTDDNEEIMEEQPFAVLTDDDAYHFMFEHFREMFYHIMLGKEDMGSAADVQYLTICDKIFMQNVFALQVGYNYKLYFRILMYPL